MKRDRERLTKNSKHVKNLVNCECAKRQWDRKYNQVKMVI